MAGGLGASTVDSEKEGTKNGLLEQPTKKRCTAGEEVKTRPLTDLKVWHEAQKLTGGNMLCGKYKCKRFLQKKR